MCPTDIELQRKTIKELEEKIETLQKLKESIEAKLNYFNASKLLLQITKKSPELLASIETHIDEGKKHHVTLTEQLAKSKNVYQQLQFFAQANDPLHTDTRFERFPESPGPSSLG